MQKTYSETDMIQNKPNTVILSCMNGDNLIASFVSTSFGNSLVKLLLKGFSNIPY